MIQETGFKFKVSADEARGHFRARAEHHRARAAEVREKSENLSEARKSLRVAIGASAAYDASRGESNDLEESARKHSLKALVFDWMADHVADGDVAITAHDAVNFEFGLAAGIDSERYGGLGI